MGFENALAEEIWSAKYRFVTPEGDGDPSIEATIARVADAVSETEAPELRDYWRERFVDALTDFKFIPAGRILAGAGTDRKVTLFDKKSAALTYCVDESKADLKNRETNKLQGTKTTPNSYVFYNLGLKKNEDGVWQTWDVTEDRGSQKCQP